jgi:thiol:disulfide interchange protein/DsbC/DsbD-like thiol-disulfide interchange protein
MYTPSKNSRVAGSILRLLTGLLLVSASVAQIAAAGDSVTRTDQVTVTLEAGQAVATPGETLWLGLRFDLIPHWHVYWRNPGDSGEAPRVDWTLPSGWQAGEIQWPVPERIPVGPLINYGYEDSVTFLVPVEVPATSSANTDGVRIDADLSWLVCKEECIPQDGNVSLQLPIGALDPGEAGAFEAVRATWPIALPGQAHYEASPDEIALTVSELPLSFAQADSIWFASNDWGPVSPSGEQTWIADGSTLTLKIPAGDAPLAPGAPLEGLLVVTDRSSDTPLTRGFTLSAGPQAAAPGSPPVGLLLAIGLAVLGGLLLNLMPCVLPVLSIKALGLVQQAAAAPGQAGSDGRRHGLAFGAGVVLTFLALAALLIGLRAGGAAIGWGFQLQEPIVVIGLMLLMLALGLNLSGVFTLGASLSGVGQSLTERRDLRGSFATGVLAVVVASPCTAPFMGTALGFALTRPAIETLLVFAGLAIGFAAPLVLLSAQPGWARLLPKPGPWMERLRNALAFPLYATAAWLLWVLTQQVDDTRLAAALTGSVLFAFGLWWLGQPLKKKGLRHSLVAILLASSLVFVVYASRGEAPADVQTAAQRWSPQQVVELRAEGRSVLVNFTAAWCITCKVNERVALDTDAVIQALKANDIVYLKGDWTNRDAEITRELQRHGRSGVPLYLLYPAGPGEPEVLPQLLTEGLVLEAIERSLTNAQQGA